MKTKKIGIMALTVVFAIGLAVQGAIAANESSNTVPSNGITYFDMAKTPDCVKTAEASETSKSYNGVTFFDLGSKSSFANGSCAEKQVQSARIYNGITVF